MAGFKKLAAFVAAQRKKIALIGAGHIFNQLFDWTFNYPLYMWVVGALGPVKGFVAMATISFLTCLIFIVVYDRMKVDWLGIEVAKEAAEYGPAFIRKMSAKSRIGRVLWWPFSRIILVILWAINKGGFIAFGVLSMYTDPFITTVYMRRGHGQYGGLSRRDWLIFLASTAVGNAWWTIRTFAILEGILALWRAIFS